MKKENDGFKMWANYVEAIDSYTKGSDEQFGRFMRILCYYGIYGQEIAETENYNFLGVQKWKEQKLVTYVLFMPLTA